MTHPDVSGDPRTPSDASRDAPTDAGGSQRGGGDRETAAAPGRSRLWIGSAIAIVSVLALLAGAVFALLTHMDGAGMAQPSSPDSGNVADGGARPVPAETPAAALAAPRPTDCTQIYSPDMFEYLESTGLPLNDGSVTDSLGSTDPDLMGAITANPTFKCSWGFAGEYGLNTNITQVSAETTAAVSARLAELDFDCSEEFGGSRCIQSDTVTDELGTYRVGESHFLRGGVWIATHWVNFAPERYTQDIVEALWPTA